MQQYLPSSNISSLLTSVKLLSNRTFYQLAVFLTLCTVIGTAHAGSVTGDLSKWAPITIDFIGPAASETDTSPNPFLDYRLTVNFTSPNGAVYAVPGFFAGDGNGGARGNQWRVRFAADQVGQWRYQAILKSGNEIAIDTNSSAGSDVSIEGAAGEFSITQQASNAPGFLAHGRLEYTGEHYLKFRDGPYWIKSGTDSPENFLGYQGIDGTVDQGGSRFLHDFANHRADARGDDPVFNNASSGADSLGITGALNYLSEQGVNSIYFLPMNLGGDGQETYPFVGGSKTRYNKTHYDISKLHQWNQVLSHAQRRGVALNIVLSETEVDNERWLDNGALGVERKLFFRELIARFGYLLAAKWNLGEENDFSVSELRKHASYLNALDWSKKPIAVHTQINNFRDYEQLVGDELFSASSIQYDPEKADEFVETWRKRSADAGRRWVIDMDENTGGISNKNADTRRKQILYDVYFSGGNLEWYYGYHPLPLGGDLTAGDFRQREAMWKMMRYARNFIETQLPFWRMQPADQLVSDEANSFGGAEVFAASGEIYAIYLPNASGNASIDLRDASGSFSLQWFNPRNGQFVGDAKSIVGGERVALGAAPSNGNDDWVVLVKSHNAPSLPEFGPEAAPEIVLEEPAAQPEPVVDTNTDTQLDDQPSESIGEGSTIDGTDTDTDTDTDSALQESPQPETTQPEATPTQPNEPPVFLDVGELPTAIPGVFYSLSVTATDAEGVAPVVTAETLPPGMGFSKVADGVANIEWQVPSELSGPVTFELIAIDVKDNSLRTTLSVTIAVESLAVDTTTTATDSTDVEEPVVIEVENNVATPTNAMTIPGDLPPIIVGAKDTQIVVGQTLRLTVIPVDPEGIVAALRLQTDLADVQLIDNGNGSRDLIWTPNASDISTHTIKFIATDSGETPHVVQQLMKVEVIAADSGEGTSSETSGKINYKPIFVPVSDQQVRNGNTVSFTVKPIDPDGSPPILHVKAPPIGASFNDNGDGSRTFSWDVPEDHSGNVTLQFSATDTEDLSITVQQNVEVEVMP